MRTRIGPRGEQGGAGAAAGGSLVSWSAPAQALGHRGQEAVVESDQEKWLAQEGGGDGLDSDGFGKVSPVSR